jgi:hypothetical protein
LRQVPIDYWACRFSSATSRDASRFMTCVVRSVLVERSASLRTSVFRARAMVHRVQDVAEAY